MRDQSLLDNIRIASPCHARWEDMAGDDRSRFCGQCNKHVYNFSAMSADGSAEVMRAKEVKLCGRLYRRRDGMMVTANCPVGREKYFTRLKRLGAVAAG